MSVWTANSEKEPAQASSNKLTQLAVLWWSEPPFLLPQYLPDRGQGFPKPRTALHSASITVIVIHTIALAAPPRTPAATLQYRSARAGLHLHHLQSLPSRRKHP